MVDINGVKMNFSQAAMMIQGRFFLQTIRMKKSIDKDLDRYKIWLNKSYSITHKVANFVCQSLNPK